MNSIHLTRHIHSLELLHLFQTDSWKFIVHVQGLRGNGNKLIYSDADQFRAWQHFWPERITFSLKPHCKTMSKRWNQILKLQIQKLPKSTFGVFLIFLAEDAFTEYIRSKSCTQLRGCCFCLFLFQWLLAEFVLRSPCGLLGGHGSCQRCPRCV